MSKELILLSKEEYGERISRLETKIDNIENKVDGLCNVETVVTELALISRQHIEQFKDFKKTQEMLVESNTKFNATLETINKSLVDMGCEIRETNVKLNDLELKVESIDEKSKVDIVKVIIRTVPWLLVAGLSFWILNLLS